MYPYLPNLSKNTVIWWQAASEGQFKLGWGFWGKLNFSVHDRRW